MINQIALWTLVVVWFAAWTLILVFLLMEEAKPGGAVAVLLSRDLTLIFAMIGLMALIFYAVSAVVYTRVLLAALGVVLAHAARGVAWSVKVIDGRFEWIYE